MLAQAPIHLFLLCAAALPKPSTWATSATLSSGKTVPTTPLQTTAESIVPPMVATAFSNSASLSIIATSTIPHTSLVATAYYSKASITTATPSSTVLPAWVSTLSDVPKCTVHTSACSRPTTLSLLSMSATASHGATDTSTPATLPELCHTRQPSTAAIVHSLSASPCATAPTMSCCQR